MFKKEEMEESLLCIVAGILMALSFIAILCGDGNKGIADLL